MHQEYEDTIIEVCKRVLLKNIGTFRGKSFLFAGKSQFRSFWTRDFCFSIPALLMMGKPEVVRDHLLYLVENRDENNLIARLLFVNNFKLQIIAKTGLRKFFNKEGRVYDSNSKVHVSILGEHGTPSFDSNLLVILGLFSLYEDKGREFDFDINQHKDSILEMYVYYESYFSEGLITQPAYSDWQDSVKREGKTSYLHVLYWFVSKKISEYDFFETKHDEVKTKIFDSFIDSETGLLISIMGKPNISLGTNLLALEYGFFENPLEKYTQLKKTPLWRADNLPGLATYPNYIKKNKSITTNWSGLEHYHDNMVWSWLIGKSIKVSKMMGDTKDAQTSIAQLYELVIRDETILEIYEPDTLNEFITTLYDAEHDFSWGSAAILEALLYKK